MKYLFLSIIELILLSEKSTAYKIGFEVGYFVGMYWPFLLAGIIIYLLFLYMKRRRKAKING